MNAIVGAGESPLPAIIALSDEAHYDVWALWVATGRRFLPSQIMNEPEALLMDIVTLDAAYNAVTERARKHGDKNN